MNLRIRTTLTKKPPELFGRNFTFAIVIVHRQNGSKPELSLEQVAIILTPLQSDDCSSNNEND